MTEIKEETLKYVIEVLEDYRNMTDHYRQEGEEYTAIDECIDELITALSEEKSCDMCGETNDSVGFSGCAHEEHKKIMICDLCDIDGSLYNGWCHEAGEEGVDPSGR